jgi:hypothetical protein
MYTNVYLPSPNIPVPTLVFLVTMSNRQSGVSRMRAKITKLWTTPYGDYAMEWTTEKSEFDYRQRHGTWLPSGPGHVWAHTDSLPRGYRGSHSGVTPLRAGNPPLPSSVEGSN